MVIDIIAKMVDMSAAETRQRYLRRNAVMVAVDGALFGTGVAVVGVETVVPAVMVQLGASNTVIGLLPALLTLGAALPPLLTAYLVSGFRRTKRYSLLAGAGQRLPWLIAGAILYFFGGTAPTFALVAVLGAVVVFGASNGLVSPIWFDIVARTIPASVRGRLFSVRDAVSQVLTLAAGAFVTFLLTTYSFPTGHALLFISGFAVFAASWICFFLMVEVPHEGPLERIPLRAYLARFPAALRENGRFRRFVIGRGLLTVAHSSAPFLTVFVLSTYDLPDSYVGLFTITKAVAMIAFTTLFGIVGDRRGHRANFVIGSAAIVVAGLLAIAPTGLWSGLALFALYSAAQGAISVSAFNLTAEFCKPTEVSLYIAISSVVTSPLSLASVLLGVVADTSGFAVVFVIAASLSAAALVLFATIGRRESYLCSPGELR
ncbi:MAG: MFS transporter [Spirochaetota bacterium]